MSEGSAARRALWAGVVVVLLSPWPAPEALRLRGRAALGWYLPGRTEGPPLYRSVEARARRPDEGWTAYGSARTAWRGLGESLGRPSLRADATVPERDLDGFRALFTIGTAPDLGEATIRWTGSTLGTAPRHPEAPARGVLRGTLRAGPHEADGEAEVALIPEGDGYRLRTTRPSRWQLEVGDRTLTLGLDFDVRLDPPGTR